MHWELTIEAPEIKPVRKRRTGKLYTRRPWLNANDRDHWRVLRPINKQWRQFGREAAEAADLPKGLDHVQIDAYIIRPTEIRSDAPNFYPTVKPIVDGLVDYGLVEDDANDYVTGPFLHPGGKGPAAVRLVITEVIP
jgi:hypothetical protein